MPIYICGLIIKFIITSRSYIDHVLYINYCFTVRCARRAIPRRQDSAEFELLLAADSQLSSVAHDVGATARGSELPRCQLRTLFAGDNRRHTIGKYSDETRGALVSTRAQTPRGYFNRPSAPLSNLSGMT